MTQELLKAIALLQHLQEDVFIIDESDRAFKGKESEALHEYESSDEQDFTQWCEDNLEEVEEYDENTSDYLVLTDDEADEKWDESLDSYIDDCILPEIPKAYQNYFDNEEWKRDARHDGRGHSLSAYDGEEHSELVNNYETFYIYRIN